MPAIKVFTGEDNEVPEGSTHEFECTLVDQGVAIQLAAIVAVRGWLDDHTTGTAINSRTDVDLKNAGGGVLVDAGGGVGKFTWYLTAADAAILDPAKVAESHRLTLKFTFNRTGGLSAGTLTHEVVYRVRNLARIP